MPDTAPLYRLSIAEAAELIRSRQLSPVDLTRSVLDRIEEVDGRTKAYVTVLPERALEDARRAERMIGRGEYLDPLHGIPIALKDICDTKGILTTSGSRVRANHIPNRDAAVTERLAAAGSVLLGKTVTHEFARGVVSRPACNPWALDRIPGGSSGGSGAAVAAGEALGAIGTDTGGSIRIPAAVNGIVGLKPTFGRVSKYGITTLSWSCDHAGPLTRTVADAAIMLQAIAGFDQRDATTAAVPVPDFSADLGKGVRGLRLGVPSNYYFDELDPDVEKAVRTAIDVLKEQGAEISEVTIPAIEHAPAAYLAVSLPEGASYHQKMLRRSGDLYTPDVRLRTELGEFLLATHYLKGQQARRVIRDGFRAAFGHLDALLTPTLPAPAAPSDTLMVEIGGRQVSVITAYSRWTLPTNLSGLPSLAVPCGFTRDTLPVSLQIIGRPFDESMCLRIGQAYESVSDWHTRWPPI